MKNILRIKEVMSTKGMTLVELSKEMGTTSDNLYKILDNNPTLKTLNNISEVLGVEVSDFFHHTQKVFGFVIVIDVLTEKTERKYFNDILELKKILDGIHKKYKDKGRSEKKSILDTLSLILEEKGLDIDSLSSILGIKKSNLKKTLSGNPSVNTLLRITRSIDVDISKLFSSKQDYSVYGLIYLDGQNYNILSFNDVITIRKKVTEMSSRKKIDLYEFNGICDSILVDCPDIDLKHLHDFTLDDIVLDRIESYDTTQVNCWSFKSHNDVRDGISLNFGNMINDFPFVFNGIPFRNSECAYIAGCYTNQGEEYIRIQNELSIHSNGLYAKKEYRYWDNENTKLVRKDWESFNIEWMKLVVWTKCKENQEFSELLLSTPDNSIIVENSTNQRGSTSTIWGCKNLELVNLRDSKSKRIQDILIDMGFTTKLDDYRKMVEGRINTTGTWTGKNLMGKILTLCRINLRQGTELDIDYDLLNRSNIYWQGEKIQF